MGGVIYQVAELDTQELTFRLSASVAFFQGILERIDDEEEEVCYLRYEQ